MLGLRSKNIVQVPRWWETVRNQGSSTLLIFILAFPIALLLGIFIGAFNSVYGAAAAGCLVMVVIVLLRWDALTMTLLTAIHLWIDWYLGLHLVAILMALALLFVYYFGRSPSRPWVGPRAFWLWILFLVLTIYPAIHGGKLQLYDLASFYPSDVVGAFVMFWLGNLIARNVSIVRRVFQLLAAFGALIAIHTLIESITGVFLFESARVDTQLSAASDYQFYGTNTSRAVSFFLDPNWNGAFLSMMFFLTLGLFIETRSALAKIVYLVEMSLLLPALLSTYSTGAWIGLFVGVLAFIVWVGRNRYRLVLIGIIALAAALVLIVFPGQVAVQLQHAAQPGELLLREAAWQTAIQVIKAFPLTGVGLGYQAYILRSNPYRVAAQYVPLSHPHDSYLEWGAMAGVPVLIVFVALLFAALWFASRNQRLADVRVRPLLGGGIAAIVALSINSISINGWTLPPLAAFGWLIAGLIASPLLMQRAPRQSAPRRAKPSQTDQSAVEDAV